MINTFFSSDFHYNHKNIVRGCSAWVGEGPQRTRDFDTLEEHNVALVQNINNIVKENDILYFLGDFAFRGFQSIPDFRIQLNVKTIHFIYGNHDHHIINNKFGCKTLFTSTQDILNKKINGQRIFLSHYSHRIWPKSHHGVIHLFGHSHATIDNFPWGKSMDCGIDCHPEFRPFHFDEIMSVMNKRDTLIIDHHNENTN